MRPHGRRRDDGFTLVELLVVIVVLGVLAAIAIPVYVGVQRGAKDASARSDLTSARTALGVQHTRTGVWPVLSASDGAANGALLKDSGWAGVAVLDDSTVSGGSPTSFCLITTSTTGTVFYTTQSVPPISTKPAGCR